jgi:hypothetical protein
MRTFRTILAFAALATTLACTADDEGDTNASASASASATESESASASATDSASGASETTSASTTDASTTTAGSTSAAGTDTAGGDFCEAEADDDACSMCLKGPTADGGCCDQLSACRSNEDCDCVVTCIDMMGDAPLEEALPACLEECGSATLPPGGLELQGCQAANCEEECA